MFSYTSMKDPTEAVTVGEHRARKAREREHTLTTVETRSTVSSDDSLCSRSSFESEPLKIVVTRSFGVQPCHQTSDQESLDGESMTRVRSQASKHKIMDESPDELVLLPVNRHIRKTYETECLYSAETNPLLEALLEEERSQRLLEEAVAAQRDETRRRQDDHSMSTTNPFYFPPSIVHTAHG